MFLGMRHLIAHTLGRRALLRVCLTLLLAVGLLTGLFLQGLRGQDKTGEKAPPRQKEESRPKVEQPPPQEEEQPPVVQEKELRLEKKGRVEEEPDRSRVRFTFNPDTPVKNLLPAAPPMENPSGPLLGDDLSQVPEVRLEGPAGKGESSFDAARHMALQIAKINHLNNKKTDGFLRELMAARVDLQTLPFAMGGACRTRGARSQRFTAAVDQVRRALSSGTTFWDQYQAVCSQEDQTLSGARSEIQDQVAQARVAALMQILAPEKPVLRQGLARYLAGVAHKDATRALARLAIFSAEDEVRQTSIRALKVRRERDYTDVLLTGLRYPLPAVAHRAADALVKLERSDLVPRLVELLDEPDPRAPVTEKLEQKQVPVVRELVRINHHRNCLLCHAPGPQILPITSRLKMEDKRPSLVEGASGSAPDGVETAAPLTAAVPVPGEALPSTSQGYNNQRSDFLVRVDVTYLRQDFSVLQAVDNAHPWPEMQRFDFLVRKRVLTEAEARSYRDKLQPREPGRYSPYHRAIVTALRELTGRDTGPTGSDWRKLLEQIEQSRKAAEKVERGSGS